jgi:hypothetical protein
VTGANRYKQQRRPFRIGVQFLIQVVELIRIELTTS